MAKSGGKSKKKGGARKHGRNKIACAAYRAEDRREHNKAKRLVAHLYRESNDAMAVVALGRLPIFCQRSAGGLSDTFKLMLLGVR